MIMPVTGSWFATVSFLLINVQDKISFQKEYATSVPSGKKRKDKIGTEN